jgi:hypothetical protein
VTALIAVLVAAGAAAALALMAVVQVKADRSRRTGPDMAVFAQRRARVDAARQLQADSERFTREVQAAAYYNAAVERARIDTGQRPG